jgi:hypothetical protein
MASTQKKKKRKREPVTSSSSSSAERDHSAALKSLQKLIGTTPASLERLKDVLEEFGVEGLDVLTQGFKSDEVTQLLLRRPGCPHHSLYMSMQKNQKESKVEKDADQKDDVRKIREKKARRTAQIEAEAQKILRKLEERRMLRESLLQDKIIVEKMIASLPAQQLQVLHAFSRSEWLEAEEATNYVVKAVGSKPGPDELAHNAEQLLTGQALLICYRDKSKLAPRSADSFSDCDSDDDSPKDEDSESENTDNE